jgi:outer membrane protein TolC
MRTRTLPVLALLTIIALGGAGVPSPASGQTAVDTLRLGALHEAAVASDPRGEQIDLLAAQADLRLRNLAAGRLPSLTVQGQSQYQSDVITFPFQLPGGGSPPVPPKDTYDAQLAVRQRLYDATTGAQRAVERARLAEEQAQVRAALHERRQAVNDAYFAVLRLRAQQGEIESAVTDLEARLGLARERVEQGAALPSEAETIQAELLRRRQSLDQLASEEGATRAVLEDLTGRSIASGASLGLPALADEVAAARAAVGELRERPEYERFARGRERVERQRAAVGAAERPRVSAYGRAGYGRPGLDPLSIDFDSYWLAGVQLEWAPWRWGTAERDREVLSIQQRILDTEEASFADAIERAAVRELANIDRLERTLASDEGIVGLRQAIVAEARLRYAEGVITSAEYVDRETDLLDARLARIAHDVELAHARARFLTLLGVEIP